MAVRLSPGKREATLLTGWRLYLPGEWVRDRAWRRRAGVPEGIEFEAKPEIALEMICRAVQEDVSAGVVLADAAHGSDTKFREGAGRAGAGVYGRGALDPGACGGQARSRSRRSRATGGAGRRSGCGGARSRSRCRRASSCGTRGRGCSRR